MSHIIEIEGRAARRNTRVNVDEAGTSAWTDTGNVGADSVDHCATDGVSEFDVEEMLRHVKPQVSNNMETLEKASKDLLYEASKGCGENYTVLCTVLELMKLKAIHGWSGTSFTDLLQLLSV